MKFIPGDKVRVIKLPTEDDKVDYFECIQLGDEGRVLPFNFGYDSVGGRYFVNLPKRKCEFWLSEDNLELMPEQGSYTIDHLEAAYNTGKYVGEKEDRKSTFEKLLMDDEDESDELFLLDRKFKKEFTRS